MHAFAESLCAEATFGLTPEYTLAARFDISVTFWGYHTLLALKAYHTILAARAYRRLDGSVGIFIDLTSDDSHPGSLLTGCHSGSLSDHENVCGCFGLVR